MSLISETDFTTVYRKAGQTVESFLVFYAVLSFCLSVFFSAWESAFIFNLIVAFVYGLVKFGVRTGRTLRLTTVILLFCYPPHFISISGGEVMMHLFYGISAIISLSYLNFRYLLFGFIPAFLHYGLFISLSLAGIPIEHLFWNSAEMNTYKLIGFGLLLPSVTLAAGYFALSAGKSALKILLEENRLLKNHTSVYQKHEETVRELSEQNLEIAIDNDLFGQSLIKLRDKIKEMASDQAFRKKAEKVFFKFNIILRDNLQDKQRFYDLTLRLLMNTIGAETGVLHIVRINEEEKNVLTGAACVAFERNKYLNRELLPGEGPAGQAYLEAETIYLTDVPTEYPKIGSATGRALPRNIVLIPLKYSQKVMAVAELASFRIAGADEVALAERLGENIASAISSLNANERVNVLLRKSQANEERLRSQEEEMRQNLEELQATQEEMARKQIELSEANRKWQENSAAVEQNRRDLIEKAAQIIEAEAKIEEQKVNFEKIEKKLSATETILKKAGEKHRMRLDKLKTQEAALVEKEQSLLAEIEDLKKQLAKK